jgi:DNA mismatch repair protein MutS
LISGPADKSYGIYCAQIAGLPQRIIDRANQLLGEYEAPVVLDVTGQAEPVPEPKSKHESVAVAALAVVEEPQQLDLFGFHTPVQDKPEKHVARALSRKEESVLKKLRDADLVNMTPMQAMNFLFELKQNV